MTKDFIHFWPSITSKKEARERADCVLEPIGTYNRKAKKILELGVGIGQVVANFPKKFEICGLDCFRQYVDYCGKNIKRGRFFVSSMHNFRINEKFDVIFSVCDSICFLSNFNQWKSTFKTVHNHLNGRGLFIFDMYTPKILRDYKHKEASASEFSMGYIFDKPIVRDNTLTWDFKVFEKTERGKYRINEYRFKERIYPIARVKSALCQYFKILETSLMDEDRRILFVCRRK